METFPALLTLCAGNSSVTGHSPHKGQWRGALMLSLIWIWTNGWVNNPDSGDWRRHRAHYDVTVMNINRCSIRFLCSILTPFQRSWYLSCVLLIPCCIPPVQWTTEWLPCWWWNNFKLYVYCLSSEIVFSWMPLYLTNDLFSLYKCLNIFIPDMVNHSLNCSSMVPCYKVK